MFFVYGKADYQEEVSAFRGAALDSANRPNLRLALCSDPKLLSLLKTKHRNWFPSVGYTAVLLQRYDGTTEMYDVGGADRLPLFMQWVNI